MIFGNSEPFFESLDFMRGTKEWFSQILMTMHYFLQIFFLFCVAHETLVVDVVPNQTPEDLRTLHVDLFLRTRDITFA